MASIEWHTNEGYALDSAQSTKQPILLDFFNPKSIGCQQMDTVTYPDPNVIEFINKYLIPYRVNVHEAESFQKYQEIWTPTLAILAIEGKEVQRTIGFLGKEEIIPVLHLGIAKAHFDHKDFETADVHFKKLLNNHPRSHEVPEAIYFRGVNLYKMKSNPSQLKKAYEQLLSEFPESPWTKRAYPYRLIQ